MVGVKATYDFSDVELAVNDFEESVIKNLVELGEAAYQTAVERGRYNNITGNLRSSIGYVVAVDGVVKKEGGFKKIAGRGENYERVSFTTGTGKDVKFWARGKAGDGSEGSQKGLEYARSLATTLKSGITLVVVAGMDYASYVNSRGYDVMDSAEAKVLTMLQ